MKAAKLALYALILLVIAGGITGLVRADETEDFIKEIIQGARSDSERSAKLMEAVAMTGDNQKLQIALLEKTVEYGVKGMRTSDDCVRVERAASLLAAKIPDKRAYWTMQKAKVYRRMQTMTKSKAEKKALAVKIVDILVRAGEIAANNGDWKTSFGAYGEARAAASPYNLLVKDNLTVRVQAIMMLAKAQEKVVKYADVLAKKPDDADTRAKIISTLLTTLDAPAAAVKYINEDVDQTLQAYVPLAAKDATEVPEEGCKSLAEWYGKDLAKNASSLTKYKMLKRAKDYYERALSLHEKADIASAAMKHQVTQIESDLAKLRSFDPLVCVYCLTAGKTDCGQCRAKGKSTGKLQCARCSSTGRMKCAKCDGKYGLKRSGCNGRGVVYVIVKTYYGKRRTSKTCSTCTGQKYRHFDVKRRGLRAGKCSSCSYSSPPGSATCIDCAGGGGTKACPKCDGDKVLTCTHCQ
jgi:hypothetical protein